ncbi:MAG TPA: aminotransferase class I/II-fold pyridoxal phosphate-dependent enzyme [Thermoanaerobaculia bacterium]|nr:aminotransferase class I/II-fold pyridoxal phosphate-dependent enzyme [Thermoanaerobaculia bacterium]
MRDLLGSVNGPLEREAPELFQALSPLGRRAVLTPGAHRPSPALESLEAANLRPALRRALGGLGEADRALAFSPSPVTGLPEVRERWRAWQRRDVDPAVPSTLPLVTAGLSHGLSLLADLFGGEGKAVAVPEPFWGNYRQAFAARTGARILTAPAYVEGRFHTRALAVALAGLPDGEPAVAMLNLPSNPGGYSPTDEERREIRASLIEVAERRPLVVVCDDAYAGLVFEPGVDPSSMFWELIGAHPNLVPVKVDGSTKELSFFGGRVGFLTFGLDPESDAARALEDKVAMLVRSTIGSPVASSQMIVLQALRQERAALEAETEAVRLLLEGRYRALKGALAEADPEVMTTLPFNSGCFALVELPEALGVTSSAARRHLLDRHDTGLVSIEPRYLRIAHCSVDAAALPELARRLERGIGELAGATAGSS